MDKVVHGLKWIWTHRFKRQNWISWHMHWFLSRIKSLLNFTLFVKLQKQQRIVIYIILSWKCLYYKRCINDSWKVHTARKKYMSTSASRRFMKTMCFKDIWRIHYAKWWYMYPKPYQATNMITHQPYKGKWVIKYLLHIFHSSCSTAKISLGTMHHRAIQLLWHTMACNITVDEL